MSDVTIIAAHPGYFGLFHDPENHGDAPDPRMASSIIAWSIAGELVTPIAVDGPMVPDAIMDPRGVVETENTMFLSFIEWAADYRSKG